jgi:hypothetical protein
MQTAQRDLLQRNKPGRMSSTNTRSTMFHWLVCDRKLTKVVSNHFRLNEKITLYLVIITKNMLYSLG